MCGLAGFINFEDSKYNRFQRLDLLKLMGKQLARRGPDDEQLFDDHRLSFVFRRLSIIDLNGGRQPIWNEDGTIFVAINGEIYNHQELRSQLREKHHFRSQSDTEIVLHLFEEQGPEALHYLNGMFAMAIWDTRRQQLFLARDRLGIKPLYYCRVGSQLIFGSELKALLVHPDCPYKPCWNDLVDFFPTSSYVQGINMLPGGYYFTFDATQTLLPKCYWSISDYFTVEPVAKPKKIQDYIAEYSELFADSVKKRLMSNVPIGAFLSGGLDSSTVVAAASKYQKDLHCFTIVEKYCFLVGDIQQAQEICKKLQLPFHPVFFEKHKILEKINFSLAEFEYFIWLIDSPKFSLEWFFKHELHRYAKTVIPDIKVVLLGQGSDEFAGGYSNPNDAPNHNWQNYIYKIKPRLNKFFWDQKLKSKDFRNSKSERIVFSTFQQEMLYRIMSLQAYNLWHEDRTASSQGIEVRVPFLDHRLVEYLAAIPPQDHAVLFWDKTIVREMARQWLPDYLVDRRKMHSGMDTSLYPLMHKLLLTIFPDFQQKYLENSNTLFPKSRLLTLFHQASASNLAGIQIMIKLLNCMAMIVFDNLCQTLRQERLLNYLDVPSPLEEIHDISAALWRD